MALLNQYRPNCLTLGKVAVGEIKGMAAKSGISARS